MGVIADGFVAYAQRLIDQTDGSREDLSRALSLSQACFNLALLPDERRDRAIEDMRIRLGMADRDFEALKQSIILPMIRRHQEMFPWMHRRNSPDSGFGGWFSVDPFPNDGETKAARSIPYPGTRPYVPCPCNSGRKYKFCCGRRGR